MGDSDPIFPCPNIDVRCFPMLFFFLSIEKEGDGQISFTNRQTTKRWPKEMYEDLLLSYSKYKNNNIYLSTYRRTKLSRCIIFLKLLSYERV